MADNVVLPGTGGTIAADEIGGAQYQRVKVSWGADGTANDTSAANPLPVSLGAGTAVIGQVSSVTFGTATAISGLITVTGAGTAVQGTDVSLTNGVYIRALSTNTGIGYVGNDGAGTVSSTTGFEMTSEQLVLIQVTNLNNVWFNSTVANDKFCWLKA